MWHNIEQNTEEWLKLRAGKVTGSAIGKVMASFGKAFGEPAKKLAVEIALTQVTGYATQQESYSNKDMERGHEQEPLARELYENQTFNDVTNGGFFDNGLTGCSPDGLVNDDGTIEIKSVNRFPQYETIRKDAIPSGYNWQTIFNLKEAGREWLDYVSFCAEFPVGNQIFIKRIYAKDLTAEFEKID